MKNPRPTPRASHPEKIRTVTCRHWKRGHCELEHRCNFRHDNSGRPANDDLNDGSRGNPAPKTPTSGLAFPLNAASAPYHPPTSVSDPMNRHPAYPPPPGGTMDLPPIYMPGLYTSPMPPAPNPTGPFMEGLSEHPQLAAVLPHHPPLGMSREMCRNRGIEVTRETVANMALHSQSSSGRILDARQRASTGMDSRASLEMDLQEQSRSRANTNGLVSAPPMISDPPLSYDPWSQWMYQFPPQEGPIHHVAPGPSPMNPYNPLSIPKVEEVSSHSLEGIPLNGQVPFVMAPRLDPPLSSGPHSESAFPSPDPNLYIMNPRREQMSGLQPMYSARSLDRGNSGSDRNLDMPGYPAMDPLAGFAFAFTSPMPPSSSLRPTSQRNDSDSSTSSILNPLFAATSGRQGHHQPQPYIFEHLATTVMPAIVPSTFDVVSSNGASSPTTLSEHAVSGMSPNNKPHAASCRGLPQTRPNSPVKSPILASTTPGNGQ